MTTLRVNKDLQIVGLGKYTGKRKTDAVSRVKKSGLTATKSSRVVDGVSGMTNKQFKLTPAGRKNAIAFVMKETGLKHRESAKIVRMTVEHTRRVGGGFFDWLGKAARSVGQGLISFIPGGGFINEGINALADKRKYNWKTGALDSAISAIPVPGLAKVGIDFALDKTGLKKKITGAGKGKNARAVIVKKVMAKTGMSMIEASKYVKAKGLYKPITGGNLKKSADAMKRGLKSYIDYVRAKGHKKKTGGARTRSGTTYEEPQPMQRPRGNTMARRGALVSKLMRENPGMSLGDASKYIKAHNLSY